MVPSPAVIPSARSSRSRSVTSARMAAASASPSSLVAVTRPLPYASMPEMPFAGRHDHGHSHLVCRGHQLAVTDRATGLDHGGDTGLGQDHEAIGEREEGIAGGGSTRPPG